MSSKIKTYNPKEVIVTCGTHIVTGYADDSFISIEPNGDGITKKTGNGLFPILIKDLKGGLVFSTEAAWCVKKAPVTRGKETNNREWELDTGDAALKE